MTFSGTGKLLGGLTSVKLFDPASGTIVRRAQRAEKGWWAGAPGACYDPYTSTFYLVYRLRHPRELGRGVECSLVSPLWKLYVSWVSPEDGRWRIGLMEASEPDGFVAGSLREIMTAETTGTEGVKDPSVYIVGGMYYMLFSYAAHGEAQTEDEKRAMHASGDIYNTGLTRSRTGAAVSIDGEHFEILGDVSPETGTPLLGASLPDVPSAWDSYCKRVGTILPMSTGGYLALYDGSASVKQNYEEQCGAAFTPDLRHFYSLTPNAPLLNSGAGSGSIRYVDLLPVGHEVFCYYEIAREDGSHDLCVSIAEQI